MRTWVWFLSLLLALCVGCASSGKRSKADKGELLLQNTSVERVNSGLATFFAARGWRLAAADARTTIVERPASGNPAPLGSLLDRQVWVRVSLVVEPAAAGSVLVKGHSVFVRGPGTAHEELEDYGGRVIPVVQPILNEFAGTR